MRTPLLILLVCINFCCASTFMGIVDYFLGFGPSDSNIMHVISSIHSNPGYQCRSALEVIDRPTARILLNILPSLTELVTENEEFISILNETEKFELIKFYIVNIRLNRIGKAIEGRALDSIVMIIYQEKAYDLLDIALEKSLLSTSDLLLFFTKHVEIFAEAIKSDSLVHLDVTTPILAGRGILHVLAEKGYYVNLLEEIISRMSHTVDERVKFDHFTLAEGNSILHSAVLSNNPEMISLVSRHFNRLCGHLNKLGWSPLKLSLINGNNYDSIKALLDHGCLADGDNVLLDPIEIPKMNKFYDFRDELYKLSKWPLTNAAHFYDTFYKACQSFNGGSLDVYKFIGLLNTYRELNASIDRIEDGDLIKSPRSSSPPSPKLPNPLTLLSAEDFDPIRTPLEKVPLGFVIDGMGFNHASREVKRRILSNLTKIESFDFSGAIISRFIQVLVKYSEPFVLAHFVEREIDYYFCVRSLFNQFENYETLIPYLDAIGFRPEEPFPDGLYPIHLAVQSNNMKLVHFLLESYGAKLDTLTVYENNNILHYGLGDRIDRDISEFLFAQVPEFLVKENNYHVSPMHQALFKTEKMETVSRLIGLTKFECDLTYYDDINSAFAEIMRLWPAKSEADKGSQDKFYMLFHTSGSETNARLLLAFVSKKLLKHLIDEKSSSMSNFRNFELRCRSRSSSYPKRLMQDSPDNINHNFSPVNHRIGK